MVIITQEQFWTGSVGFLKLQVHGGEKGIFIQKELSEEWGSSYRQYFAYFNHTYQTLYLNESSSLLYCCGGGCICFLTSILLFKTIQNSRFNSRGLVGINERVILITHCGRQLLTWLPDSRFMAFMLLNVDWIL